MIPGTDQKFQHPERQLSIENQGRILKMSGAKRRLGTTNDARFGISEEGKRIATKTAKERAERNAAIKGKPVPEKINLRQSDYFTYGILRNPLLIIYFVGLKELTKDHTEENETILRKCRDTLYIGFGIGIPALENQETKYAKYVLNKVALQKLFEGEADNWTDEEEFDD